jgi:hypothetical protein
MAITGEPVSIHIKFKRSSGRRNPVTIAVTATLGRSLTWLGVVSLMLLILEDALLSLVDNIRSRYVVIAKN